MAARSQQFGEAVQRRRMDGELAIIRKGLNDEDPSVSAAKVPTDRADEADVIAGIDVSPSPTDRSSAN